MVRMLNRRWVAGLYLVALLACVLWLPTTGLAADRTWTTAGTNGAWLTTTNWSGSVVPGSADVAVFNTNPGTTGNVGINFNGSLNNGTQNQIVDDSDS